MTIQAAVRFSCFLNFAFICTQAGSGGRRDALAATAEEDGGHASGGLDFKGCDKAAAGPAVERAWCCFADDLDAL
jgi:hypothetical protein